MRGVAVLFGIGHLRPAPGTWASAVSVGLAFLVHLVGGPWLLLLGIALALPLGHAAASAEISATGISDPAEVVIDELAGQWIACLPVSFGAWLMGVPATALWPGWVAAFLLFRLFDVWKPGPIGRADRRGDALGVMLDDSLAGVVAAISVVIVGGLFHALMQ